MRFGKFPSEPSTQRVGFAGSFAMHHHHVVRSTMVWGSWHCSPHQGPNQALMRHRLSSAKALQLSQGCCLSPILRKAMPRAAINSYSKTTRPCHLDLFFWSRQSCFTALQVSYWLLLTFTDLYYLGLLDCFLGTCVCRLHCNCQPALAIYERWTQSLRLAAWSLCLWMAPPWKGATSANCVSSCFHNVSVSRCG